MAWSEPLVQAIERSRESSTSKKLYEESQRSEHYAELWDALEQLSYQRGDRAAHEDIQREVREELVRDLNSRGHALNGVIWLSSDVRYDVGQEIADSRLLAFISAALAIISLLSLVSWISNWGPMIIVNPFVAMLLFVFSPFVWLMSRAARVNG